MFRLRAETNEWKSPSLEEWAKSRHDGVIDLCSATKADDLF